MNPGEDTSRAMAYAVELVRRMEQEREMEFMYAVCKEFPGAVNCRGGRVVIDEQYQSPPERVIPASIRKKFGRQKPRGKPGK